jgi:ribosomal protein S12 methylthiotransferase
LIRGRQVSRPVEVIVQEAGKLASGGVREIILVAQDLTAYGRDRYGKNMLPGLVRKLDESPDIDWIRLHYAHPASFPEELLDVMAASGKVCRYLDIPFQHISDGILSRMNRGISGKGILALIGRIRKAVPGIALRTSLMVGYPGEREMEFRELMEFVAAMKFERLGVFTYSHEEGTAAAKNETDNIPQKVKEERRKELMKLQSGISLEINRSRIGTTMPVLIDRREGGKLIGRTEFDSPEVDNEVVITPEKSVLGAGDMVRVRISDADEYDLFGRPAD